MGQWRKQAGGGARWGTWLMAWPPSLTHRRGAGYLGQIGRCAAVAPEAGQAGEIEEVVRSRSVEPEVRCLLVMQVSLQDQEVQELSASHRNLEASWALACSGDTRRSVVEADGGARTRVRAAGAHDGSRCQGRAAKRGAIVWRCRRERRRLLEPSAARWKPRGGALGERVVA